MVCARMEEQDAEDSVRVIVIALRSLYYLFPPSYLISMSAFF